jgi:hypothetical protein
MEPPIDEEAKPAAAGGAREAAAAMTNGHGASVPCPHDLHFGIALTTTF